MRIKIIDRILAALLALFTIAALVLVGAVILDVVSVQEAVDYAVSIMPGAVVAKIVYGIIGVIVLIIAFRVVIGMAGSKPPQGNEMPTSIHLVTSEYGATYVSLAAIDAMAQRHCRAVSKVKDCMTNITPYENGVRIAIKLVLSNEANIPELTASLQKSLKAYVEELSGVTVSDVSILIISAPSTQKLQA